MLKTKFLLFQRQSLIVAALVHYGIIHDVGHWDASEVSTAVQDFLICCEMLLIAIAHVFIFGHSTYRDPNKDPLLKEPIKAIKPMWDNFMDSLSQKDVVSDAVTTFDPRKKDPRLLPEERQKMGKMLGQETYDA